MTILNALRNRRSQASGRGAEAETSSGDEHELPISGYDGLKERRSPISCLSSRRWSCRRLRHTGAHEGRHVVLDKLRYMRGGEPLPGYDALTTEQIAKVLAGADAETVKAVRDYERKFQHRKSVLDETVRVLPSSQTSAREERAHEEKAALLREGYADRERTAPDPPG